MTEDREDALDRPMAQCELRKFLFGNRVEAVDPESLERFTIVSYLKNGTCQFILPSGEAETGIYGFEDGYYWTRYSKFRGGKINRFSLIPGKNGSAQAYFADGRRAYLQRVLGPVNP